MVRARSILKLKLLLLSIPSYSCIPSRVPIGPTQDLSITCTHSLTPVVYISDLLLPSIAALFLSTITYASYKSAAFNSLDNLPPDHPKLSYTQSTSLLSPLTRSSINLAYLLSPPPPISPCLPEITLRRPTPLLHLIAPAPRTNAKPRSHRELVGLLLLPFALTVIGTKHG